MKAKASWKRSTRNNKFKSMYYEREREREKKRKEKRG